MDPNKAEGAEENLRSIVEKVVAFNKLFFHGTSNFLWSYHTEMRKYFKVLGFVFVLFLNIFLKYCYIEMKRYTSLNEALCGIFKEESRKFELLCGLHPKALTIHHTLVTVSVCNSS